MGYVVRETELDTVRHINRLQECKVEEADSVLNKTGALLSFLLCRLRLWLATLLSQYVAFRLSNGTCRYTGFSCKVCRCCTDATSIMARAS